MPLGRRLGSAVMLIVLGIPVGCSAADTPALASSGTSGRSHPPRDALVPTADIIVGRTVSEEHVFVLTDAKRLLQIDPFRGTVDRIPVTGISAQESLWGLARLGSGSLWTLIGTTVLGEIGATGRITRRIRLQEPHVGLYGWKDYLIYQPIAGVPQAAALTRGLAGSGNRDVFGSLRLREFRTSRPEMLALNLVLCGVGRGDEFPCWFRDEARIDRIHVDGSSRPVRLDNLIVSGPTSAPATAEEQPRPIWDVYISESRDVWVLCPTGVSPGEDENARGGWHLFRYTSSGQLMRHVRLTLPARLILAVRGDVCFLLTKAGGILEVQAS